MKVLLLVLLGIFSNVYADTSSPQATFKTYLKAMVNIKNNQGSSQDNYEAAISTLDLSQFSAQRELVGQKVADDLVSVLDKIKKVDYDTIPTKLDTPIWYFDQRVFEQNSLEISLIKIKDQWLFSQKTIESLEHYKNLFSGTKEVAGVTRLDRIQDKFRDSLPSTFQNKMGSIEYWQLLGLLLAIILAFIVEKIAHQLIGFAVTHLSKVAKTEKTHKLDAAIKPLSKIIFVFMVREMIVLLDFSPAIVVFIERVLLILMSFMAVWFGHKVIELVSFYATRKAQETEAKFDDILIPLLTKTSFVVVYILGGLLVAKALTINVSGIVAGLGIGGLAFAFAAKDTLANFFGSIMLVLDRPFDIGDIITAGDITGVVTEVGFRSTRIRTFNDSLITVSNGELMNRPIDNQGKRRFRRLNTTLGVEYGTPPQKIEAFCEGIRQLILNHRWTRKDSFHVYFENFGASSLDIKVIVYWETDDYARELAEKHRLNIDIVRLAKEIGVEFAFPTQTVHLFNETAVNEITFPDKPFDEAREKASKVVSQPLSLKNPRSNSQDEEQFGKNDIGI